MAQNDRAIVREDASASDDSQAPSALTARLREALGDRTAAWLAKESGIKDASIRKYLAGGQPTVLPAVKMADALGVRLTWLLAGQGPMRGPEEQPAQKASGHQLFDAAEADWVFLPFYRFESAMQVFTPVVTETFPVRRDWIKRTLGVTAGLWVTEMPVDDMPSVAEKGEAIICRNAMFLEMGAAYLLGLDGNMIVRRYTVDGLHTDRSAEVISPAEAQLKGVIPIGEILARFGLSRVVPKI